MNITEKKLNQFQSLVTEGLNTDNMLKALSLIDINYLDEESLKSFRLWNDFLPRSDDFPYTEEQRYLHMLWEFIDKVPLGINVAFSIPFRSIIAKKLFKRCGDGFIANEGCRFNYGHLIEVGGNVTWNHCCYIDSKGGVEFEDSSMITEYTKIFTHSHSESDHMERTYHKVVIGSFAKIYTAATILPGVTIGKGAVVATGSIVTKSVDDFSLVAGIPAKPIRERRADKTDLTKLNHFTLKDKWFQK